jgi:hypothetical protein
VPDREPGLRCLQWVQEELQELPAVVGGFMSYASLVTCEGAMNTLSREGCRHFEVFDQADEDFDRDVYKVEDLMVKDSAGPSTTGCGVRTVARWSGSGRRRRWLR